MKILILNGSPRLNGDTASMVRIFQEAAEAKGHLTAVYPVCRMDIRGCLACEYCHGRGQGSCIQKDDMKQICSDLSDTEMLVLAAPIYYHGISGQLKCVIDRFYSVLYPTAPKSLKKVGMLLSSGDPDMYDAARFSYEGDFLGYLGLEGMGIITNHDQNIPEKIRQMVANL